MALRLQINHDASRGTLEEEKMLKQRSCACPQWCFVKHLFFWDNSHKMRWILFFSGGTPEKFGVKYHALVCGHILRPVSRRAAYYIFTKHAGGFLKFADSTLMISSSFSIISSLLLCYSSDWGWVRPALYTTLMSSSCGGNWWVWALSLNNQHGLPHFLFTSLQMEGRMYNKLWPD